MLVLMLVLVARDRRVVRELPAGAHRRVHVIR
jgi:hypothetical protein